MSERRVEAIMPPSLKANAIPMPRRLRRLKGDAIREEPMIMGLMLPPYATRHDDATERISGAAAADDATPRRNGRRLLNASYASRGATVRLNSGHDVLRIEVDISNFTDAPRYRARWRRRQLVFDATGILFRGALPHCLFLHFASLA